LGEAETIELAARAIVKLMTISELGSIVTSGDFAVRRVAAAA